MTRDGLIEENLRDGSIKDISHRSRGRPENKEEFVPERERKRLRAKIQNRERKTTADGENPEIICPTGNC